MKPRRSFDIIRSMRNDRLARYRELMTSLFRNTHNVEVKATAFSVIRDIDWITGRSGLA